MAKIKSEPETLAFCAALKVSLIATAKSSRQLAREVGLGHATLSRIASGKSCDVDTYFRIKRWMAKQGNALEALKDMVAQAQIEALTQQESQ